MNEGFVDTLRKGLATRGKSSGLRVLNAADKRDDLTSSYFGYLHSDNTRIRRYQEFDDMDEGIIATALDLIVDDATQYDREANSAVWVNDAKTRVIKDELTKLLTDVINVDEVIGDWGRQVAKYGDFFVQVYGEKGKGITRVDDSYHPSEVERIDTEGELRGFIEINEEGKPQAKQPWDFVHFKIQGSPRRKAIGKLDLRGLSQGRKRERVSTKYGVSILENAIAPSKKLNMVEDSLVLSRLARSPLRRLYFINVGTSDVKEAAGTINHFKNILKKRQSISKDGSFRSENHPFVSEEDVFIPVSDVKNEVNVQEFGGEVDVRGIADIDFLKNKLFASIKVPQAFLGFEEALNGRNTLRQLDARYARTVKKVQNSLLRGLIRLCQIHLAYLDIDPDSKNFELEMSYVSTIEEIERQEAMQIAAESMGSIIDVIQRIDMDGQLLDKAGLVYYLMKEHLHFNDDLIGKIAPAVMPNSAKKPEEQPKSNPNPPQQNTKMEPPEDEEDDEQQEENSGVNIASGTRIIERQLRKK